MSNTQGNLEPQPNGGGVSDKARRRLINVWTWVGIVLLGFVALYLSGILASPIGIIIWSAVFVFMLRGPVN